MLPREEAPGALRAQILGALDEATRLPGGITGPGPAAGSTWRGRAFWAGALSGLGAAGLAAALVLPLVLRVSSNPLLDELAAAHLRSLQQSRLIAVESTDRHTVKPWFAGRADVAPAVADFDAQGYRLLGGRVDPLQGQRAAVVVYQHGAHVINVFSWERDGRPLPDEVTRRGYRIACWSASDLGSCAVSDADFTGLRGLERLLQGLAP